MLYNDVLLGIYDSTVVGGESEYYKKLKQKHAKSAKENGEYGYLFDVQEKLYAVLEDKFCLGVQLRESDQKGDKKALGAYLPLLKSLPNQVEALYQAVKKLWEKENKPFGLEVELLDALGGGKEFVKKPVHSSVWKSIISVSGI